MQLSLCGHNFNYGWIQEQFDPGTRSWSDYERQTLLFCQQWLRGQETFVLHTSGSTGKPKPIHLTREQMVASARATGVAVGLQAGQRALVCLNTAYIAGVMMLVRGFEWGLHMRVIAPTRHPFSHLNGEAESADFVALVPLQLQCGLENAIERLNQCRTILVGGAAVSEALIRQVQTLDVAVYHTYGMTETVSHIALRRLNGEAPEPYFEPLPNVRLALDQRGCLTICGAMTRQQTIVTNDRVALRDDGAFRWLGRVDNVINTGGVKVQAEQVEAVLERLLPGRRLFVCGLPDEDLGERVTAVIEGHEPPFSLKKGVEQSDFLTRYEQPRTYVYVPQFSETATGKIDRKAFMEKVMSEDI